MTQEVFFQRARILDLIREWFRKEGFLEVETPIMAKYPGMEPDLDLFSTEFISKDGKIRDRRYLLTSPEYAMKKLLGRGYEKIFTMTKAFRNGETGSLHNAEFTMLEWYRANADYLDIMRDTERMIRYITEHIEDEILRLSAFGGSLRMTENTTDNPWKRLSVREAFQRFAEMDLDQLRDYAAMRTAVQKKGYELSASYSWDDLFFLIMLNEVEPKLRDLGPVFLMDYPASQAALSKKKSDDPCWAERFELYIHGVELCNAFSELTDHSEQRARLLHEQEFRRAMGKEVFPIDEEFLEALKTMPRSGGNALGIDRLVMVLLGKTSLEEVMLFPWK